MIPPPSTAVPSRALPLPLWIALLMLVGLGNSGCPTRAPMTTPLPLAQHEDPPRFMGDWYVIPNITTFIEQGA